MATDINCAQQNGIKKVNLTAGSSRLPHPHPSQNESGKAYSDPKNFNRASMGSGASIRNEAPGSPRQAARASMSSHFIPYRTVEEIGMKQPGRSGPDLGRGGKTVIGTDKTQVKRPVRYQHG